MLKLITFNPAYENKDYSYIYGLSMRQDKPDGFFNQIIKINVKTGKFQVYYEDNTYYQEPIFVPLSKVNKEDAGTLLSLALDGKTGKSSLIFIDATTMEKTAVATLAYHIPFGFHGIWISRYKMLKT